MAKEAANHASAAPLFAAARAVLNEVDQQNERFMEQAGAAARAMLDTVEKMAESAAQAAAAWTRS